MRGVEAAAPGLSALTSAKYVPGCSSTLNGGGVVVGVAVHERTYMSQHGGARHSEPWTGALLGQDGQVAEQYGVAENCVGRGVERVQYGRRLWSR